MEQKQTIHTAGSTRGSDKLPWVSPQVIAINTSAIQQEEDEIMQQLLSDPDSFRLLTGSLPSGG
jgi:hypothetical protein